MITAAFLVITVASVLYPFPEIFAEMFVVLVGALFAFTSMRVNLPGAPAGFGISFSHTSPIPYWDEILGAAIGNSSINDNQLANLTSRSDFFSILPVLVVLALSVRQSRQTLLIYNANLTYHTSIHLSQSAFLLLVVLSRRIQVSGIRATNEV